VAGQHETSEKPLDVFVSLHEAAQAYDTSAGALRARARAGGLRAYKVAGAHGREWRVSLRSLEAAGFATRVPVPPSGDDHPRVRELEAELTVLRRLLVAEKGRADRADQELGHALLEVGRFRSALTRAVEHS